MLELTLIIITLIIFCIAAYVDVRTLEVPDWLNFSGIAAGLGIHIIYSLQQWAWWPILSSIIGFAIGFGIACLMFYTAQWGGGDAKLLMAAGALIGFEPNKFSFGADFLINLVIFGAIWGLLFTFFLAIKNHKKFWRTFKALRHQKQYFRLRLLSIIVTSILIIFAIIMPLFQLEIILLAVIVYLTNHLIVFVKSTELVGMYHWLTPDKLVEGDWLVHDIKIGKLNVSKQKLGLEKKELSLLQKLYKQKKIDKILVRYGVPFTPAFLLAFVSAVIFGNIIFAFI